MAMHFDLTDMQLMVNISEVNSLTKGAERSFLSLPAASNRIKNLKTVWVPHCFTGIARGYANAFW